MNYDLLHYIYIRPLKEICLLILFGVLSWTYLGKRIEKTVWRGINVVVLIASLLLICYATLYRSIGERTAILSPFYSFVLARTQPEFYRMMLMNVFLFVPFGLAFPFAIGGKNVIMKTVLTALSLSGMIELLQFAFKLGWCEADDIIMNTIGAAIGCMSCFICIQPKKEK